MAVLVHCVICHVHVALLNGLTIDTAKVDSLFFFLQVVLYDLSTIENP